MVQRTGVATISTHLANTKADDEQARRPSIQVHASTSEEEPLEDHLRLLMTILSSSPEASHLPIFAIAGAAEEGAALAEPRPAGGA